MATDDGSLMIPPGGGMTVSFSGNRVSTLVNGRSTGAYSVVEWVSEPGIPGTPLHIHRETDESFYVLEGTFAFQAGERTFEGAAGAFVFVPKGVEHAYWNAGKTLAKILVTIPRPASSATSRSWPRASRRRETTRRPPWGCARRSPRGTT